jgi:ribosomal protein S18 acetylase RimI-like enzyme
MEIRLANRNDHQGVIKYDSHIHHNTVDKCIQDQLVYVLCDEENIVGILRYSLFWQSIPFLDLLYIDEAYRGKGYGRHMMDHWESVMQTMKYEYVMLSTQEDETEKYFYEKLGYRRIGAFLPPDQDADEIMYLKMLN